MDNSTDQSVPEAEREQPEAKVNYRTGKRSVSGWIRADLVQYAEEVAHAEGRSMQSVMQDALETMRDLPEAPVPDIAHITIQNKDQDREMCMTLRVCGYAEAPAPDAQLKQPAFAIDFRRGIVVSCPGGGTQQVMRTPQMKPERPDPDP